MTWYKHGTEFPDDCAEAVLSDAAFRTHVEAINYIYRQENFDLTVKKSTMRRWAGSDQAEQATSELVAKGMWTDGKTEWTVVHHADVIRQSLAAQQKARETSKKTSAKYRAKAKDSTDVTDDVTRHVTPNTDRQTDKQPREGEAVDERIDKLTGEVFASVCDHPLETAPEWQRDMCNSCWTATAAASSWNTSS